MSRHFPSHANQRQFDRRSFLRKASIGTVGLSGVALVGSYGLAYGDEAEFVTLWVLNSNWGTLRGPAGKERTACRGNACHRHAANKIFMSEAFANSATGQYWPNGGKLHPCCLATAEPIQVKATTLAALLEHSMDGGKSVDRRCLGVPEILKLSDPTSTTTTTSTPSTTSSSTVVPDPAPSSTAVGAAATLATTTTELPQQTAAPKPPRKSSTWQLKIWSECRPTQRAILKSAGVHRVGSDPAPRRRRVACGRGSHSLDRCTPTPTRTRSRA